jgi:hypothetical protein
MAHLQGEIWTQDILNAEWGGGMLSAWLCDNLKCHCISAYDPRYKHACKFNMKLFYVLDIMNMAVIWNFEVMSDVEGKVIPVLN